MTRDLMTVTVSPRVHALGLPTVALPNWFPYLLAGIVATAIILLVISVAWPQSKARKRIDQISHFGPARATPIVDERADAGPGGLARSAMRASQQIVRAGGQEARIAVRLERAGIRLRPHEWVLIRIGAVVLGLVLGWILVDIVGAVLGALVGLLATTLYLQIQLTRRVDGFADQLPDGLQLVIGSLRSGFSLPQALDALVRESPEPLASEFGRAVGEYRLGGDLADALERVAARTRNPDLGWAIIAIRIQREVGGNLAEVLQTAVETMRERGRLRRHVRSLSAEGRLSGYVLIALPVVIGAFMFLARRDYVRPLYTQPLGIMMLLGGGVLLIGGVLWMLRVVKVEV
jgi:Flp pilus assembly protein TadB